MTKVVEEDPDLIVADAEEAAREADALVTAIEDRIMAGDTSVTHEDLSTQISVARFAARMVEGARSKAEQIREGQKAKAREALRAEVLKGAPENGERLLAKLDLLVSTSRELQAEVESHDAQVRAWFQRAVSLQVPDKGLPSKAHAGLAVNAGGDVLVDDMRIATVGVAGLFNLLFTPVMNGIIPTPDEERVAAARTVVANIGKAGE